MHEWNVPCHCHAYFISNKGNSLLSYVNFPFLLFRKDLEDTLSKFLEDLPEDKYQLFMSLSDCKSEEKSEIGKNLR